MHLICVKNKPAGNVLSVSLFSVNKSCVFEHHEKYLQSRDLLFFIVGNTTKVTSVDHSINKPAHKKIVRIGQEQFH